MSEDRTRSEYRLPLAVGQFQHVVDDAVHPSEDDRDGLAQLMLDGYRGSVDDEGETFDEACEAVDFYLSKILREHSFVLKQEGSPVAMSLVLKLEFNDVYYIDPIVVTAALKQQGLGRQMVETSLASLAQAGVTELGATITDGNEPSERLFASFGAVRVGPWPPA